MNLSFLTNDELKQLFERAKAAVLAGERIVSVNDGGLSFTKQFVGEAPDKLFDAVGKEIARRIARGEIDAAAFPQIKAQPRKITFPVPRAF